MIDFILGACFGVVFLIAGFWMGYKMMGGRAPVIFPDINPLFPSVPQQPQPQFVGAPVEFDEDGRKTEVAKNEAVPEDEKIKDLDRVLEWVESKHK